MELQILYLTFLRGLLRKKPYYKLKMSKFFICLLFLLIKASLAGLSVLRYKAVSSTPKNLLLFYQVVIYETYILFQLCQFWDKLPS